MQTDGHEVTIRQLEPAGHSKCANIPRQDSPIQTTGVDLAEGSNTLVCIQQAMWHPAANLGGNEATLHSTDGDKCVTSGTEEGLGCPVPLSVRSMGVREPWCHLSLHQVLSRAIQLRGRRKGRLTST